IVQRFIVTEHESAFCGAGITKTCEPQGNGQINAFDGIAGNGLVDMGKGTQQERIRVGNLVRQCSYRVEGITAALALLLLTPIDRVALQLHVVTTYRV